MGYRYRSCLLVNIFFSFYSQFGVTLCTVVYIFNIFNSASSSDSSVSLRLLGLNPGLLQCLLWRPDNSHPSYGSDLGQSRWTTYKPHDPTTYHFVREWQRKIEKIRKFGNLALDRRQFYICLRSHNVRPYLKQQT